MKNNTHANKAESYDIGRPEYPAAFFDFLYAKTIVKVDDIIADIGCGTGKVTRHFLERGNKVIAIEPDGEMLRIADKKLKQYPNYLSFQNTAENTGIENGSASHIFCGNSYHWFDRKKAVPEFRRILKRGGTVVISRLGGGENDYDCESAKIIEKYKKAVKNRALDTSPPFLSGTFLEKTFDFAIYETFDGFLHGSLSASFTPSVGDKTYEPFCDEIKQLFEKYQKNGRLEAVMRLHCMIGDAVNLSV
ncbi:MAG: class I SAM-dependent methyltransferase [Oscillospiraceae bacterium]|nr:class I SAM-dependent methyltransferase [Oscillospiraceae bacterium]